MLVVTGVGVVLVVVGLHQQEQQGSALARVGAAAAGWGSVPAATESSVMFVDSQAWAGTGLPAELAEREGSLRLPGSSHGGSFLKERQLKLVL